jgi:signal peptidase II
LAVYIIAVICGLGVLGLDQLTKYYIMSNFALGEGTDFIKYIVDIYYIHNRGAAWGMLSGRTWLLLVITALVMVFCVGFLIKNGNGSKLLLFSMTLVISGGIGNMIDRVFRNGNVIDFLHFVFWPDFPVFNVADCAIVIGAGLLILYFLIDTVKEYKTEKGKADLDGDN